VSQFLDINHPYDLVQAIAIYGYHRGEQKEKKPDVMALAPVATVRVLGNSNADAHQTRRFTACAK
jgi:hypothetical protein